jgi:hypothetical protein
VHFENEQVLVLEQLQPVRIAQKQETRSKSSEEESDGDQVEMLRRMLSVKDYQENALKEELGRKK